MRSVLIRWFVLTISVWVAAFILPGIHYNSFQSLLAAALVLGVLNSFVKPLLTILSLPFILLTLGLFMVIINTLLLMATGYLVKGFYVLNFWAALGGSIIISIVSLFMNRRDRPQVQVFHQETLQKPPPPPGRGPVIDID